MPVPATVLENKAAEGAAGHHLLVMGPDLFATYPLPPRGVMTIGRAETADVRLDDPLASRQHARLHIGESLQIEDLGSANKTRVREQALQPGERVGISPGEAVAIGSTILMVQQRLPPRVRVLRPHGYIEARLEEECARSEMTHDPFALVRLKVDGGIAPARLTELVAPVLRLPDMLALYGPNEYEVLLASTPADVAESITRELELAIASAGGVARAGMAVYPRDGRNPEALLGAASRRIRGGAKEPAPAPARADPADPPLVHDPNMMRVMQLADRAATGTINVLIIGETGAGKEVLAERVHRLSARAGKPFLCLNCASLSEHLLESELFGHERGAFTGASEAKPGLLETAPGGTVFLDEIGEMPLPLQAKLLRVLETRSVTRVGGLKAKSIDVRFVAATNRNLEEEVAAGRFRRDLYFRLNGMTLHVPPLRTRRGEILQLAAIFLRQFSQSLAGPPPALSAEAERILEEYVWPGNVRELRNMMERAVLLCTDDEIRPEHLLLDSMSVTAIMTATPAAREMASRPTQPAAAVAAEDDDSPGAIAAEIPGEPKRERILRVLAECGGNQSRAAKILGIARSTLVLRLNEYRVPRPRK